MCGIAGVINLAHQPIVDLGPHLGIMNRIQAHRGPDGEGVWEHPKGHLGLAHRRLGIIDLTAGHQPMTDGWGNWVTFNGEIYNYLELRESLGVEKFRTRSDTEVILHAYRKWGSDCVNHFRGMFAFALWDEESHALFCARDRFGIKPFYYSRAGSLLYFASEVKALLPFIPELTIDREAFKEYLTFQFYLEGKTPLAQVRELCPGHILTVARGQVSSSRYWDVYYDLDFDHTEAYFQHELQRMMTDSVRAHLRSDVPIGAYVSGGMDSSIVACLAEQEGAPGLVGFQGKFSAGPQYDESGYGRAVADWCGFPLQEVDIQAQDFIDNIGKVIYHLDYPLAGPGSFPQYMVSQLAARQRKVVLGGQGGDEIFGGYTRYLIAYFEQCIKAAINGTAQNGNFIVTYESIIPNLGSLREYQPLLKHFWQEGLFDDLDMRYFRLINRAPDLGKEVAWDLLGDYSPFDTFRQIFNGENVRKESYFDLMTHFDFKTLLPPLLHVEDRCSMAHGLEARVPFLDHALVEFAATIPSNIKFKNGTMKHLLRSASASWLPPAVTARQDKMGFPVPLTEWLNGPLRDFVVDLLSSTRARQRGFIDNRLVLERMTGEPRYGRKLWGFLCLEIWQSEMLDRHWQYRQLLHSSKPAA